jgi:hypothetical protein
MPLRVLAGEAGAEVASERAEGVRVCHAPFARIDTIFQSANAVRPVSGELRIQDVRLRARYERFRDRMTLK